MKLSLLIGFLPVAALSVGMEQIVVEEPGRTNRSAQAWADAAQPGRLAATMPYVDSIAATSTYPAGLVYVPAALAASTRSAAAKASSGVSCRNACTSASSASMRA